MATGASVFARDCVGCRGAHDGGAFPNPVAQGEIGTDPLRAAILADRGALARTVFLAM